MRKGKGSGRSNGLLPNSLRIISSCLKTVSSNASSVTSTVRSAGASLAASISVSAEDRKDQVLWAGFDKLELSQSTFKHVLLLGYSNGFQVLDVEDASNVSELVSKRDDPVTFLQIQSIPAKSEGGEGFRASHPLLLVVAGDENNSSGVVQGGAHLGGSTKDGSIEPHPGNSISSTAVRFYSLKSHSYVHVLRFRSAVCMVRCSPRVVAVGLAAQIYCFDSVTLETKFSVLTYPVPQVGVQGVFGINSGYGPMAVGPRWLAYASNSPLLSNMGRLSPQILTPSPGVSPSTSPGNGSLVARYAMESSKQLAAGIINLGDMGYKTLSKYCQERLPDGSSSPVSSNGGWKVSRVGSGGHSTETENAGMVIVKDFVSKAVISQFRAHTSPISALCFDPSGTLLVTASVHGNNINIFRIMPSYLKNGSGTKTHDWSSSHVHLYKLHRGMTSAVIQDICFSQYSQWAAIVSSRGTCHIFVMSPFGGDADFQTQKSHNEGPTVLPGVSLPWWSTSSWMDNQQSIPPPPPVTLSVLSRIKDGNSGWLNTVSNAAASATGKASIPSGAIAAVFHNSAPRNLQSVPSKTNALENLLVYTPSGHLVQHELRPSLGVDSSDNSLRAGSESVVQVQDEELRVKGEPVQWWDVCRRSDWPEREECISRSTLDGQKATDVVMDTFDYEDSHMKPLINTNGNMGVTDLVKPQERLHWYLSNAEVQVNSGRIPIWQNPKISFYTLMSLRANESLTRYNADREIEIEKFPAQEIEIRRKDLLPVFDHFPGVKSSWNDRGFGGGSYHSTSSFETYPTKDKFVEDNAVLQSKPVSLASVESLDRGSSQSTRSPVNLETVKAIKSNGPVDQPGNEIYCATRTTVQASFPMGPSFGVNNYVSTHQEHSDKFESLVEDSCITNDSSSLKSSSVCNGRAISKAGSSSNTSGISGVSNASSDQSIMSSDSAPGGSLPAEMHEEPQFGLSFQEGYCKASELDEGQDLTGFATDADSSSSQCEKEKPEEDGESDDLLGGVFAFSEEG